MRLPFRALGPFPALLLLTACATISPPQPPSLNLPKPPSDLRAVRTGDEVTLTWTVPTVTTDRQKLRSVGVTKICRGIEPHLLQCGTAAGTLAAGSSVVKNGSQSSASYADKLPKQMESDDPSAFATYAIEVQNAEGRSAGLSNEVRVPLIVTLAPPRDFRAQVRKEGVVLSWTGEKPPPMQTQQISFIYRVYRRLQGEAHWASVGDVAADKGGQFSLTDSNIEWEKTYEYRVATATTIPAGQIDGDSSAAIAVLAHDVFPPAVPEGLQAVFSGPGQTPFVDLIWAPVSDADLDGYNVYRHEEGAAAKKINATLLKTPAYRDSDVVSGKHYFYSVTALDVRGNESAQSEEAEESVP